MHLVFGWGQFDAAGVAAGRWSWLPEIESCGVQKIMSGASWFADLPKDVLAEPLGEDAGYFPWCAPARVRPPEWQDYEVWETLRFGKLFARMAAS